jgi:hypothetical protein
VVDRSYADPEEAYCGADQGGLYRNPSCEGMKNITIVRIVAAHMVEVELGSLGLRVTGLQRPVGGIPRTSVAWRCSY